METYENQQMKVTINENGEGKVLVKAFGDVYSFTITPEGTLKAKSSLALSKATKAKNTFGFNGGRKQ